MTPRLHSAWAKVGRVRWVRWVRFAAAIPFALLLSWGAGLVWFAGRMPDSVPDTATRTDAIVVLTGGSDRVRTGLELLERRLAEMLFISGVGREVDVGELLRVTGFVSRDVECCVVLGYDAGNTAGNARETARWMRANGYRSLRLVTASYHMQRSLLEVGRSMPEALVIPHPVFPPRFEREGWWRRPETTSLVVGEYNKYLFSRLRLWQA